MKPLFGAHLSLFSFIGLVLSGMLFLLDSLIILATCIVCGSIAFFLGPLGWIVPSFFFYDVAFKILEYIAYVLL
jgi:hypothetical protein